MNLRYDQATGDETTTITISSGAGVLEVITIDSKRNEHFRKFTERLQKAYKEAQPRIVSAREFINQKEPSP